MRRQIFRSRRGKDGRVADHRGAGCGAEAGSEQAIGTQRHQGVGGHGFSAQLGQVAGFGVHRGLFTDTSRRNRGQLLPGEDDFSYATGFRKKRPAADTRVRR